MIVVVITGASYLSEFLKVNDLLQELYMNDNLIGDNGMSLVADGLQCNKVLRVLNVGGCGLSVKGSYIM